MNTTVKTPDLLRRISIFNSITEDRPVRLVVQLIEDPGCEAACFELFRLLAENAELSDQPQVGSAWQDYLLNRILSDENIFARKAELTGYTGIGDALKEQVSRDLAALRILHDFDLKAAMQECPDLDGFKPVKNGSVDETRLSMKRRLHERKRWKECVEDLAGFFAMSGVGEFGRFKAFRWVRSGGNGMFKGVASPDPIKVSDLVEYEWQREAVKRNTEKLLMGLPTNNMLLYGDRGTGKSSTVKAMLNEFGGRKLRLVEVSKDNLTDLPDILSTLRERPEKFILFIDDLSFEENETQYKALKAVLEGGLEARPVNVALYATSNRRNLIKEKFSDRIKEEDEVHPGDTMQEKLSLSDRFGLKLPFLSPDQEEYLRIVTALAQRAGIELNEDLRKKALSWQHARSGRSARQFVDYIIGEFALGD